MPRDGAEKNPAAYDLASDVGRDTMKNIEFLVLSCKKILAD